MKPRQAFKRKTVFVFRLFLTIALIGWLLAIQPGMVAQASSIIVTSPFDDGTSVSLAAVFKLPKLISSAEKWMDIGAED